MGEEKFKKWGVFSTFRSQVDLAYSSFTVDNNIKAADGVATVPVYITLRDKHDQPITNLNAGDLSYQVADILGVSPLKSKLENIVGKPGEYKFTLASTKAGDSQVSHMKLDGVEIPYKTNNIAHFVAGSINAINSELSVNQLQQDVGKSIIASIQLKDQNGNIITKAPRLSDFTFSLLSVSGHATVITAKHYNSLTHCVEIALTDTTAEPVTIKAMYQFQVVHNSPIIVHFNTHGDFTDYTRSTLIVNLHRLPVGDVVVATVQLQDQYGNVITPTGNDLTKIVFNVSPNIDIFELKGKYIIGNLIKYEFTSHKAQTVSVTANYSTNPVGTAQNVTFVAGVASSSHSTYEVSSVSQLADNIHTVPVTLIVHDQYDNPVTGLDVSKFSYTVAPISGTSLNHGGITSLGGGVYQFSLTSAKSGNSLISNVKYNGVTIKNKVNDTAHFISPLIIGGMSKSIDIPDANIGDDSSVDLTHFGKIVLQFSGGRGPYKLSFTQTGAPALKIVRGIDTIRANQQIDVVPGESISIKADAVKLALGSKRSVKLNLQISSQTETKYVAIDTTVWALPEISNNASAVLSAGGKKMTRIDSSQLTDYLNQDKNPPLSVWYAAGVNFGSMAYGDCMGSKYIYAQTDLPATSFNFSSDVDFYSIAGGYRPLTMKIYSNQMRYNKAYIPVGTADFDNLIFSITNNSAKDVLQRFLASYPSSAIELFHRAFYSLFSYRPVIFDHFNRQENFESYCFYFGRNSQM